MGEISEFLAGGGDSPNPPSRENPVLIAFAPERVNLNFILYSEGYFKVVSRW